VSLNDTMAGKFMIPRWLHSNGRRACICVLALSLILSGCAGQSFTFFKDREKEDEETCASMCSHKKRTDPVYDRCVAECKQARINWRNHEAEYLKRQERYLEQERKKK
jgi:hypothetical protein